METLGSNLEVLSQQVGGRRSVAPRLGEAPKEGVLRLKELEVLAKICWLIFRFSVA